MPEINGLEATRQICKEVPMTKVLILSGYSDEEYVRQLIEAGAIGFLQKQTACAELLNAIREARRGNAFFSPSISRKLLELRRDKSVAGQRGGASPRSLSSRESEVLQLIAGGKPNKQIADDLSISVKTVEKHRQQVMNKLNIHEVAGLTRYAVDKGMIQLAGKPE
jgi:DNA-binding NarL/FixJ family response regulator